MQLLDLMNIFVTVADVGSFTRAAEVLQMSRPQATLAVQELETQLGARLLHRTTRKVSLTAEGEAFHARARDILASVTSATTMFGRSPGGALGGRLRVDLPSVFGQPRFMAALAEFTTLHPGIDLALGVSDRLVDLVAEGVDCAVRIGELASSSLVARRIGALELVTCAAPAYLASHGTPTDPDALGAHRGVRFLSGGSRRPMPWLFRSAEPEGAERRITVRGSLSVNEAHAYVNAAVAGFGIVQLPGILVERELAAAELVEILAAHRPAPWPVSVVCPSRAHQAPQVGAFIDWLAGRLPQVFPRWVQA